MATEYLGDYIYHVSQGVLEEAALENGAIVAANSSSPDYPPTAENYLYVWPRDAAYQMVASKLANVNHAADIRHDYIHWLLNNCQGFSTTGEIVKRYYPNGAMDWRYGLEYQPDQAGASLWALHKTVESPDQSTDTVMRLLAKGLVNNWQGHHFNQPVQDLWENQLADPNKSENFSYTLTICLEGLSAAIERFANQGLDSERDKWLEVHDQMETVFLSGSGYWNKKILLEEDTGSQLDSSASVVAYPYSKEDDLVTERRKATVIAIHEQLYDPTYGVLRYAGDTYDGIARSDGTEATAGYWPLLTFWHAISLNRIGMVQEAGNVFNQAVNLLGELYDEGAIKPGHIPEQIFVDDERQGKGVTPLAWAHAKFIIACSELNI